MHTQPGVEADAVRGDDELAYRELCAGLLKDWFVDHSMLAIVGPGSREERANVAARLAVGFAALVANGASFGLLWAYRTGDANMRSAWICSRNDVLGNLAVLLAAVGVFGTGTGRPDIIVAAIMAGLALQGAALVIRQSLGELRHPVPLTSTGSQCPEAPKASAAPAT